MKASHRLWICLCLLGLCLTGCGKGEDPYLVDTVIQIPVDPTEERAPTELPTEPETTVPSEPEPTKTAKPSTSTSKPSTSTSTSTSKPSTSTGKPSATKPAEKETEPPTEPPTTPPTEPPTEPEVVWTELPTEPPYVPEEQEPAQLEQDILNIINAHRQEQGAGLLAMDARLSGLAAVRVREGARLWSHTRPDGRGWETVLTDDGYTCSLWAEHLIYVTGVPTAAALAQGWLDTPNNAQTLLDPAYTTAGVAVYEENGYTFVALLIIG